jgi:hypothetical protein
MADIPLKMPMPKPSKLSKTERALLKSVKVEILLALARFPST